MAVSTVTLRLALKFFLIFAIRRPSLTTANSCCYCFHGEEAKDVLSTNTYESLHVYQENTSTLKIQPKVALQILLLLSGDIERCQRSERGLRSCSSEKGFEDLPPKRTRTMGKF